MKKIVCLGSLNLDHVYRLDHFVRPGETLGSESYSVGCGGKGLNQSIALARAGAPVMHAGRIGHDGGILRSALEAAGVDVSLLVEGDVPTGHAIIQVDAKGENAIILYGGANRRITEVEIDAALDAVGDGILLLQNEINSLGTILEKAHARGIRTAFNFAPFDPEDAKTLPLGLLSYLIVNEIEGAGVAGVAEPEAILRTLKERYPGCRVILTLGKAGAAFLGDDGVMVPVPPCPAEVVDTTSAGDTFIGYLFAGLLEGMELKAAMELAGRASAITVSRAGAADSIPFRKELR
ncbi:MAG TPA: ribokinase [Lentisphaeria bacterium]|uniref:ribokinase n=1 Tax=Victivallis lenta TaxID=2606640 RepID=UPI000D02F097|nr:ribokinase [Victivallis lenta]AVM45091.1 ribokinase [Victivallales bacterium CCUG 44730]MBS5531972.1 ribokinase [bacterium]HBP05815.1 ribokinase [Lentisphaeria bacterium]HCH85942.1 ribokinase [Lentisphaeria bacterium]